jgi:hypothetical protein
MEKKILKRSYWKIPAVEEIYYQYYFYGYFIMHNPKFVKEMQDDLIPFYFNIFGRHNEISDEVSWQNWASSNFIAERDYEGFFIQIRMKLEDSDYEVANEKDFTEEKLRKKCNNLLDKILEIIKRYNLSFGATEKEIPRWIIHTILGQIEATTPAFAFPPPQFTFPREMIQELWKNMIPAQQIYLMNFRKDLIKENSSFKKNEHFFENLDVFFESPIFLINLPPPIHQFRNYDIFEDMKNYEKMAVEAYRKHIKLYLENIKSVFKKYGFKRNKKDEYTQTEWLVIWNKYSFEFLWEIITNIPEFQNTDSNNDDERNKVVDNLRKAFDKFKRFGLPVRPYGNNRKNKKQKMGKNVSGGEK